MSILNKTIRRETGILYRGRPIMLEVRPPGLLVFRLKKIRKEYPLAIATAFESAIRLEAEREVQRKKEARKAKREGRI